MTSDYILGIAILGHELSLSLVDGDGQVVFIAEEERYSRRKRGEFVFHPNLTRRVLDECGVLPESVGTLAVAGNPSAWTNQQEPFLSFSSRARARHLAAWIDTFHQTLPCIRSTVRLRHHRAHAASVYFASGWDHAAVITLDGFGDGEVATISEGRGASLNLLEAQPFPHSLPYLYHAFAEWLGLDGVERDGKLMALAAYGRPTNEMTLRRILSDGNGGPWRLSRRFLQVECKSESWTRVLEELLGPKRQVDEPLTDHHFDAAASIQSLLESELVRLFQRAKALTGASRVCCAGGAFFNCKANGKLKLSKIFDSYFFQPLAGDCGLSLGAALQVSRARGRPPWLMSHLRLGSNLNLGSLPELIRQIGGRLEYCPDVAATAVQKLASGSIIGWCQGRMEVGPRSLCGRSILADPRSAEMRDRVNQIKSRESWRPFAPVMLLEETPRLFGKHIDSPHMNVAFGVTNPELIPAAVHIDGTARIQTVREADDPLTHRLLTNFRKLTGIGVLLNTSLNIRGQPIARTIEDCLAFLCESDIDALFIGNYVVERSSTTQPIDLTSSGAWKQLPPEFLLIVLDLDKSLRTYVEELGNKASESIVLTINGSFEICESTEILERVDGRNVVLLLPGHLEVLRQTLPRALHWARRMRPRCAGLWLADLNRKVIHSDEVLQDMSEVIGDQLSDVEIHYLRSMVRKRQVNGTTRRAITELGQV